MRRFSGPDWTNIWQRWVSDWRRGDKSNGSVRPQRWRRTAGGLREWKGARPVAAANYSEFRSQISAGMNTSPQLMRQISLRLARRWVALTPVDIIGDSHPTAALPDVESREICRSVHACLKLCQILQNKDDESEAQLMWWQMHFQVPDVGVALCIPLWAPGCSVWP